MKYIKKRRSIYLKKKIIKALIIPFYLLILKRKLMKIIHKKQMKGQKKIKTRFMRIWKHPLQLKKIIIKKLRR